MNAELLMKSTKKYLKENSHFSRHRFVDDELFRLFGLSGCLCQSDDIGSWKGINYQMSKGTGLVSPSQE